MGNGPGVHLGIVEQSCLDDAWPQVREGMQRAMSHAAIADLSARGLYESIKAGDGFLVLAALVPEFGPVQLLGSACLMCGTDPQGERHVTIIAVAGERMQLWIEQLFDVARMVARMTGAGRIIAVGRPGWQKMLSHHGVRVHSTIISYSMTGADRTDERLRPQEYSTWHQIHGAATAASKRATPTQAVGLSQEATGKTQARPLH